MKNEQQIAALIEALRQIIATVDASAGKPITALEDCRHLASKALENF